MSRLWSAVGFVVLAAWLVAVPLGLARAVLGREPSADEIALGWLPGLLLAIVCFVVAAWPRLMAATGAWRPGTVVEGFERGPERPRRVRAEPETTPAPSVAAVLPAPVPPPITTRSADKALVHLGPKADPAWAAWSLRWDAPGHGHGVVVLPPGARILIGRDPRADVVVRLDQVSWQHLELDVKEGEVTLLELESSNGTFDATGARIAPRRPWRWEPRTYITLAQPTAIVLTLEALR